MFLSRTGALPPSSPEELPSSWMNTGGAANIMDVRRPCLDELWSAAIEHAQPRHHRLHEHLPCLLLATLLKLLGTNKMWASPTSRRHCRPARMDQVNQTQLPRLTDTKGRRRQPPGSSSGSRTRRRWRTLLSVVG
jgi:hypothetical protein